ncbi:MAG: dihydrolipoyl dehydrogenase [Candidatus Brocadiaceae bacterium]|jgi:dihydrolipoamide dehydrogenase
MSEGYDFDVAVIGSGPAGYVAGIRASQLGARTCVIEKGLLGGVCTNVGCIPTKVLWHTASTALRLEGAEEIGLKLGRIEVDWPVVAARRDAVLEKLRGGIEALLAGNDVELVRGRASFSDPHTLRVGGTDSLTAAKIMVATGSRPVELPRLPFDHEAIIDSADAVTADELPDSVVIVGGGYIGLEFASIYTACGVGVTVVEALDRLLPAMDKDCAREVTKLLKGREVRIHTGVTIEQVDRDSGGVRGRLSDGTEVSGEKLLVCVGRRPDVTGLEIENAGLEPGEGGEIPVNEHMQASRPHIYAIGDVNGQAMLAHVGSQEGLVAAAHATGALTAAMDYRVAPACVFVHPEVAVVGLSEEEAHEETEQVVVKKFPFRALGKAHVVGETQGLVKMVCDGRTGQILGIHMAGPDASVLLGEAALALQLECTAEEMADTIHAHPTLAEALKEAAEGVIGMPINWRG